MRLRERRLRAAFSSLPHAKEASPPVVRWRLSPTPAPTKGDAMDQSRLDYVLLQLRVEILELMVLRLSVVIRASGADRARLSDLSTAVQSEQDAVEIFAKEMEAMALSNPKLHSLSAEERAVIADEIRELMERWKSNVGQLFPF